MIRKILLCPYFGPFPEWMDLFLADFVRTMKPQGYDLLLDTDLQSFKERVKEKLGIEYPGVRGTGKVWDYRGSLGLLYEEEAKGYEYWGIADFDVVWGNVSKFIPDEKLIELDIYSSHDSYVCGCFSLFKNSISVNTLFREYYDWKEKMIHSEPNAWVEKEYSDTLKNSRLRYSYDISIQGNPFTDRPILKKEGNRLFQSTSYGWQEVGLFHFRRSKHFGWPL